MNWLTAHWPVLVLLVLYTALLINHALVGKRRTRTQTDYYVGGRAMGGVALGMSFFATYSSTNSFVGFSGQSYSYGAPWLLLAPGVVIFSLIAWVYVAPRLREFTASVGSVTLPDYIGFRFESTAARVLAALIVIFASFLYMTAVFKGIGNLLEIGLEISYTTAIFIVFLVVMLYTAVGGFISVVKTDVVQGTVMVAAAFLLFGGTVHAAGGIDSVFEVARTSATEKLFTWNAAMPFPVLLGIILAGTFKFVVEPRQLSRFYALADQKAVRHGTWVSTATFLVVYSLLVPIGLYAHRIIADPIADSDLVVPTLLGAQGIFHPIVAAFLLVAMVAAAMSSLDSVLLVMASTCERDVVGLVRPPTSDGAAVRATRFYVALFALITAVLALNPPGGIVTLTAFSGSLYAACFFPAVFLGLHWNRGSGWAVITSFLMGVVTLAGWRFVPWSATVHSVFPAMLLSTLAYVVLSLTTRHGETKPSNGEVLFHSSHQ